MIVIKTIQRRLEALEKEERLRKHQERVSLAHALIYAWHIVFAYYLGGLVLDDNKELFNGGSDYCLSYGLTLSAEGTCNDFEGAIARALKCSSREDYDDMLLRKAGLELPQR